MTRVERTDVLRQVAEAVAGWDDCQLFGEASDKNSFRGVPPKTPPFEEAFTQVASRLHRFLTAQNPQEHGLLVQDRNETMARRLTALMRAFHKQGTRWTTLPLIVETPLFVDSHLTSLVQVAGKAGEPNFHELEPNGGMVAAARHHTRRCLSSVTGDSWPKSRPERHADPRGTDTMIPIAVLHLETERAMLAHASRLRRAAPLQPFRRPPDL